MSDSTRPLSRYALADALENDQAAIRLVMDMLKATTHYEGHAVGFSADIIWSGQNRAGYTYFLGSSRGQSDPSFENYRTLPRDITPALSTSRFIRPNQEPGIKGGFWQFTPEALEWYRNNSGPTDDEVRKQIGRMIADTDPTNEFATYSVEMLAHVSGASLARAKREVYTLINAGFLEHHRIGHDQLGPLRFTSPTGVRWAAADFPSIASFGTMQTHVTVSLNVEVRNIINQVQASGLDPAVLEQYELRLRRVEEELEKPDGQGRLQTIHDLVETANGSKDLLIPTVGFLATHAEKIKTFAEGITNMLPG